MSKSAPPSFRMHSRARGIDYKHHAAYTLATASHNMDSYLTMLRCGRLAGKEIVVDMCCGGGVLSKLCIPQLTHGLEQLFLVDQESAMLQAAATLTQPSTTQRHHFIQSDITSTSALLQLKEQIPSADVLLFFRALNHFDEGDKHGVLKMLLDHFVADGGLLVFDIAFRSPAAVAKDPASQQECVGWNRQSQAIAIRPDQITPDFMPVWRRQQTMIGIPEQKAFDKDIANLVAGLPATMVEAVDLAHEGIGPGQHQKYEMLTVQGEAMKEADRQKALDTKAPSWGPEKKIVYTDRARVAFMKDVEKYNAELNQTQPLQWLCHSGPYAKVVVLRKSQ